VAYQRQNFQFMTFAQPKEAPIKPSRSFDNDRQELLECGGSPPLLTNQPRHRTMPPGSAFTPPPTRR
jgi:hypothetical protein